MADAWSPCVMTQLGPVMPTLCSMKAEWLVLVSV
jgi:hypothetical protein